MKCKPFITLSFVLFSCLCLAQEPCIQPVKQLQEPMQTGKFKPTWKSLEQYQVPEWYCNAKFGIWAHWGPQCQPEHGDWYAHEMYIEGSNDYKWHLKHYGHPSKFGFKDIIHKWKAQRWDPEKLIKLYKRVGAQYFVALGNHHDNFDLWDSKYHNWNSVKIGPKKDILKGWAEAARKSGLHFGVSIHSSHAWTWYEPAQGADTVGIYKGVPYDGKLTKADGNGKWWQGLDPQELYCQNHPISKKGDNSGGDQWDWGGGASIPNEKYCENFYNRTIDMINKYHPDLVYFDDTALPLWPVSDVGLYVAADFYNSNLKRTKGKSEGVILGKKLTEEQKKCLVWDVERGAPDKMQEKHWQTCSCIGNWHYDRSLYDKNGYKTPEKVIQMLADIVSKNGNLLLSIPVRGDGTIDDKEENILENIAKWMDVNRECIFDTHPWKTFGEGPDAESYHPLREQGYNEGKSKYTEADLRFTQKGKTVYVICMKCPNESSIKIKSFAHYGINVQKVELLGYGNLQYIQTNDSLTVRFPKVDELMPVIRIITKE